MKNVILASLACALALAGCNSQLTGDLSAAVSTVGANVTAAQSTLKKVASTVPQACATIKVAEGYFDDVAFTGLIPASAISAEASAAAIVNTICTGAPTTLSAVSGDLGKAWAVIQAATTVPGK